MVLDGGRRRPGPTALRGGSAAVIGLEEKMLRDDHFLRREYGRTLIPVMFSVLAGTINTLIDSAFVAQRIGNDALAAVNMCGPLYQLICTFGSLLAGGASILSSGEAGRDDMESSRRYYHTALLLGLAVGALATAAGLFFCAPISLLLSQGGALSGYVYDYSLATFAGLIPVVIAYLPLYYLQLEGKGKEIMIMMGIVIGTDVVLDWVFLYLFDFGMAGAAAASVLSMAASCVYGFLALQEEHSAYRLDGRLLGFKGTWEILKYGSPAAVGNLMDAVRLFLLNSLILLTLGTKGAAVWAVLNSLSELSLCISSGVPQAAGPMIAVFHSVKENSGIRILLSNLLVGLKRFFFPLAAALVLAACGGPFWLFLPLGGVLAVCCCAAVTAAVSRKSGKGGHCLSRFLLLDDYLEREGLVLDFSIAPSEQNICDASDQIREFCIRNHMDQKGTNRIAMAIEEMLMVMKEENPEMKSVDLRAFAPETVTGIRIRCAGDRYDPFERAKQQEDLRYLGVNMLRSMAGEISYSYTLGMNTLYLEFPRQLQDGRKKE